MLNSRSEIKVLKSYTERFANCDLSIQIDDNHLKQLDTISRDINNWVGLLNTYIHDISGVLAHISAGDLTAELSNEDSFKGDFIPIKNALKKIIKSLNKIFIRIDNVMDNIEKVSKTNKIQTHQVAENAVIQSYNIKALSEEITKIFEKTEHNQKNISIISDYIIQAKDESEKGKESIEEMLNSISKVLSAVENINNVTEFIESISRQTKILSINASIEASRAGAAGKGFAVVATEIGSLAKQTSDSVQKTAELIEESINQVKLSAQIAKDTSKSFNSIQSSIDKVSDKNDNIVEDTNYQTSSLKKIVSIVNSISDKVESNASFAKENAAGNETLLNELQDLKELLGYFVLEGQTKDRMIDNGLIDKVVDKFVENFIAYVESSEDFNDILTKIILNSDIIECAYILNENGFQASDTIMNPSLNTELSNDFKPALIGHDHSHKKYYVKAMAKQYETNNLQTSVEYISGATGNLCKTFSKVYLSGKCKYVLCIDVKCMK